MALITISEAAAQTGIPASTIRYWLQNFGVRVWRLNPGGTVYFRDKDLEKVLEKIRKKKAKIEERKQWKRGYASTEFWEPEDEAEFED